MIPATKVSARTNLINMPESVHQLPNPEEGGSDGARDNSSDGAAAVPAASPPTAAVKGEATASSEKVARKRWKFPSLPKLPSLPILKILQGTMEKVNEGLTVHGDFFGLSAHNTLFRHFSRYHDWTVSTWSRKVVLALQQVQQCIG